MEASEFFDEVAAYLGRIVKAFNQNDFPENTLNLIEKLCEFIEKENKCLSMKSVELQLRDALISLDKNLKRFRNEALSDSGDIAKTMKQNNFNGARDFFKDYIRLILKELKPKENGLPAPSTVWRNSFRILEKILG